MTLSVTFKDEGEEDGVIIGPVCLIDRDVYRPYPESPPLFGEPVPGLTELGWHSKPEAIQIARDHGVELEEV